jgi:hypothetical protein
MESCYTPAISSERYSLSRVQRPGGGSLENAQAMAAHESPRSTKLYDRTDDQITLDEVQKIGI